ncbi:site-specific DNA-methyltransferase [Leucobacter chromiireducens]|nr:site-specific DNA-methyltransferase [Leucobacter chromiireducens]
MTTQHKKERKHEPAEATDTMYEATPPRPKGTMTGRLTLSWRNKDQALIGDGQGGYLWVDPSDPRAAEVRTLNEVATHGDVNGDGGDNLLIQGDSVHALIAMNRTPELADKYRGKVKMVYIDPPFNTGQAFDHYADGVEHSVWLGLMRERFVQIKELLLPEGSIWVHLDDSEVHYAKVLMDEIFGRTNYVTTVVWQKRTTRENRATFSSSIDFILVYAMNGKAWRDTRNRLADRGGFSNPDNDPKGPWRSIPMTAQGFRANQMYEIVTPTGARHLPPKGRCWGMVEERFEEAVAAGRIYWPSNGNGRPRVKRYPDEVDGLVPFTLWPAVETGTNDEAKKQHLTVFADDEAFSTPKPERLIERVLEIGSNPGDLILDCFGGSATTAAVAHKMGRRWVTTEIETETVEKFIRPRLLKVIDGSDTTGISGPATPMTERGLEEFDISAEDAKQFQNLLKRVISAASELEVEDELDADTLRSLKALTKISKAGAPRWAGGGGFRELVVDPASFQVSELAGMTIMSVAPGTSYEQLARSVAAQLGYRLADSLEGPIVGALGKSRLAVIDGTVDAKAVAGVLSQIDEQETVVIAATTVADDARAALRSESKGSRIISIPNDLFPKGGVIR